MKTKFGARDFIFLRFAQNGGVAEVNIYVYSGKLYNESKVSVT